MRFRLLALPVLLLAGVVALSLTHGQDPRPATVPPVIQTKYTEPSPTPSTKPVVSPPAAPTPARDLSKLTETQKQALLLAQRGATWLNKRNLSTGRFQYGILPALARPMEGDNFLHQATAALALARAARVIGDKTFEARAAQAVLTLLDQTMVDPKDAQVRYLRYTSLPSLAQNRLAAAGLLVAALHELPTPQADLLDKSDQLCNFIRRQARPDGSLCTSDLGDDGKPGRESFEAANEYPGLALYGLMLSQRQRPAAWKTDLARRAVVYYHPWWKANKNMAFIPAQTAAYTEAYLLTKEPAFAACVVEMNDWLCDLQYERSRVEWWYGGFKSWKDGHEVEDAPSIGCAVYGESLANACRIARETADVKRYDRYNVTAERNVLFVGLLQYTMSNTLHYDAVFRSEYLLGGFHPSQQDGDLRIDYTAQAVTALLQYVEQVR
jgi:hypothetical protein